MFARIALFGQPFSTLTYALPPFFPARFWQRGLRVAVPLGKNPRSLRVGCLVETCEASGLPPGQACKEIHWPLELSPLLGEDIIELASELATRQGITAGEALGAILPHGLKSTAIKIKWLERQQTLSLPELRDLPQNLRENLALALLGGKAIFRVSGQDAASMEMLALNVDPPWPTRPAAKRQIEILEYLYANGLTSRRALAKALGNAIAQPLKSLIEAGFVSVSGGCEENNVPEDLLPPPPPANIVLNERQTEAFADLRKALDDPATQSRLLYGVTGSGKTAVYLELAKYCLSQGKSAFLLAPEVALAHKLFTDAKTAIPLARLVLYHGYQHPARREAIFRELAACREPRLIIGTRSALFLPIFRPALAIMDEEHDSSYKQDERMPYHAREIAWFRMAQNHGLLLLGSATPDIKTFYASQTGKLPILRMPARIGNATLPPVELVNIGLQSGIIAPTGLNAAGGNANLLAPETENALKECLARNEQAVILLNRRGYAPLIYCIECAKTLRCPHCEIGLNFHKGHRRLVCHYCDYSFPFPSPCPTCGAMNFMTLGEGTEKVAERLETISGQEALRLDRDSSRRSGSMENILESFARGESPFIVGTQMLSKGHHFPNVTLVVVADGDIGLNLPDYRAAERTFQLLVQSAGRAGRGDKKGRVLIQTRNAGHYFWRYILNYDYEGFYADELERRRKRLYPPFTFLALLRVSFPAEYWEGPKAVAQLGAYLREKAAAMGIRMLGPAPAPISMLRGQKRFHCLLKCGQWRDARAIWHMAKNFKPAARLRIFLDLDPVNML